MCYWIFKNSVTKLVCIGINKLSQVNLSCPSKLECLQWHDPGGRVQFVVFENLQVLIYSKLHEGSNLILLNYICGIKFQLSALNALHLHVHRLGIIDVLSANQLVEIFVCVFIILICCN